MYTATQIEYYEDKRKAMKGIESTMRKPSTLEAEFHALAMLWHRLATELEQARVYECAVSMTGLRGQELTPEYREALYAY